MFHFNLFHFYGKYSDNTARFLLTFLSFSGPVENGFISIGGVLNMVIHINSFWNFASRVYRCVLSRGSKYTNLLILFK